MTPKPMTLLERAREFIAAAEERERIMDAHDRKLRDRYAGEVTVEECEALDRADRAALLAYRAFKGKP